MLVLVCVRSARDGDDHDHADDESGISHSECDLTRCVLCVVLTLNLTSFYSAELFGLARDSFGINFPNSWLLCSYLQSVECNQVQLIAG